MEQNRDFRNKPIYSYGNLIYDKKTHVKSVGTQ